MSSIEFPDDKKDDQNDQQRPEQPPKKSSHERLLAILAFFAAAPDIYIPPAYDTPSTATQLAPSDKGIHVPYQLKFTEAELFAFDMARLDDANLEKDYLLTLLATAPRVKDSEILPYL